MIKLKQQLHSSFLGLVCIALSSCSGDNSDLIKYINDIKARPAKAIEPIPQFTPLAVFIFPDNGDRRSPFKPTEAQKNLDLYAPDQKRKKQPLEAYPLDALKFVGILEQGSDVWGLIEQPDKKITRVRVGDYMGQNYGRIIVIKQNLIKLEETTKDSGMWKKQITTINLYTGK